MKFKGWGSLVVILRFMLSGTNDFAARIAFDMGFAIVLFGPLKVGISISLLADWLAHLPNFFVFRATFRLETPWFMPDFSVTVELDVGQSRPAGASDADGRGCSTCPARGLAAGTRAMRIVRIDGCWWRPARADGAQQPARRGRGLDRVGRAVLLDALLIEIQFSPMLADRCSGIGQTNPDLGRLTRRRRRSRSSRCTSWSASRFAAGRSAPRP